MRKLNQSGALCLALLLSACSTEHPGIGPDTPGEGAVRISLAQDVRVSATKADDDGTSPSIDDFEVEIYNAAALRLYRKPYSEAKDETIRLNAGEFRLVAHHGDSLGAGFGKAYWLADQPFTVHGYVDNGGEPDRVEAVARLSNVKIAVEYGDNLKKYYSDFYTVVRHNAYSGKSVLFSRTETRCGYMPGGDLYLEVFAQLAGKGIQDGGVKDSTVYFKTEPVRYDPNDFVTFHIETGEREGSLTVGIIVDKEVETIGTSLEIASSALPDQAPVFSYGGENAAEYLYEYPAGVGAAVADALLSVYAPGGFAEVRVETESAVLDLPGADLLAAESASLQEAGLRWYLPEDTPLGAIDFSGLVPALSLQAPYDPADPVTATFRVTVTDRNGRQAAALFRMAGKPVRSRISVKDVNIWGWKVVDAVAEILDVRSVDPAADIRIQCSTDGTAWTAFPSVSISGTSVHFADVTGLQPDTEYLLRAIIAGNEELSGETTRVRTEYPQQIGNSGFESFTELEHTTAVSLIISYTPFTTQWWQLYTDDPWWAVNSPVTLRDGTTRPAYQDYKTYPTVALFTDGAYEGTSVMLATVAIGDYASEVMAGSSKYYGQIFLGTANDACESAWAQTAWGHAFGSRPSAVSFQHRFNPSGSTPFYVHAEVLDGDDQVIGEGLLDGVTASVGSWTECTVPLTYSVTDRKARSIRLDFRSSEKGTESTRKVSDIKTLSGTHKIYAGNILYLDNISLQYK